MKIKENIGFKVFSNIILTIMCLCAVIPFTIIIGSSFSAESALMKYGYGIFPKEFDITAYRYLLSHGETILRAYKISFAVTIFGTGGGLIVSSMLAYPLSRSDFKPRKALTFFVLFTMLFNGGLVPTYLMYTQIFHIKNTLAALIFPNLFMKAFYIIIMRTYFKTNIPGSVIESAKIDGAGELRIYAKIVLPMSLPILATVGLLSGLMYWNDWVNGLYYITDKNLFSLQNLLNRMLRDIQFLQSSGNSLTVDVSSLPSTTLRMAIAVIGAIPILLIYPFFQKFFAKGLTVGSVKG
jgi:putative aldouronate transport system permease protein